MDIMDKLIAEIKDTAQSIFANIDGTSKAAVARFRKATLVLEKLGKRYRKESIAQHN